MKKLVGTVSVCAAMLLAGCSHPQPVYYPPPPVLNLQAIQQQGFHDGFEAARRDVATGRPPAFDHHPRFRRPPVPPPGWEAYRHGFGEGYNRFLHPAPPPGL